MINRVFQSLTQTHRLAVVSRYKHKPGEWTQWLPVVQDELTYREEDRGLPVPPYMQVIVRSEAGEYPDIEPARYFAWECEYNEYSLTHYKVRLH